MRCRRGGGRAASGGVHVARRVPPAARRCSGRCAHISAAAGPGGSYIVAAQPPLSAVALRRLCWLLAAAVRGVCGAEQRGRGAARNDCCRGCGRRPGLPQTPGLRDCRAGAQGFLLATAGELLCGAPRIGFEGDARDAGAFAPVCSCRAGARSAAGAGPVPDTPCACHHRTTNKHQGTTAAASKPRRPHALAQIARLKTSSSQPADKRKPGACHRLGEAAVDRQPALRRAPGQCRGSAAARRVGVRQRSAPALRPRGAPVAPPAAAQPPLAASRPPAAPWTGPT